MNLPQRVRKLTDDCDRLGIDRPRLQALFWDVPGYDGVVAMIGSELVPCPDPEAMIAEHAGAPVKAYGGICPWTTAGEPRPEWAGPWRYEDDLTLPDGSPSAE